MNEFLNRKHCFMFPTDVTGSLLKNELTRKYHIKPFH